MIQIIQLKGTDRRLYELVAPLVMNPDVLKQNYNYPFRTSEDFVWFVAVEKRKVIGFIPVEEKKKEYLDAIPMHKLGKAEDVANVVSSLCSDAFSYVTGQVIVLDGGLSL